MFGMWQYSSNSIPEKSRVNFMVAKLTDIINILLPIFSKYPLQGTKKLNFMDFCKVVELMKNKAHLTPEGLEEIRKIKSGMNTGRDYEKLDDLTS